MSPQAVPPLLHDADRAQTFVTFEAGRRVPGCIQPVPELQQCVVMSPDSNKFAPPGLDARPTKGNHH